MTNPDTAAFYPLTQHLLHSHIPSAPGTYALAVRLANGTHHVFLTGETENLHEGLWTMLFADHSDLPVPIREYLERFQCYLAYELIPEPVGSAVREKMMRQTNDPIARLRLINSN